MNLRTWIGGACLVVAGFAAGLAWCLLAGKGQAETVNELPRVTVYEDGYGYLPAGTHNSVLGDLSGRGFCLTGELCND